MSNGLIHIHLEWIDLNWQDFDALLDNEKKFISDFVFQSTVIFKGNFCVSPIEFSSINLLLLY